MSEWLERKGALNPTRVHFSLYFSKHRELWRGPCKIFGDGQLHFSFSPQHKEKYNSPKKRETSAFSRQLETDFYGCFRSFVQVPGLSRAHNALLLKACRSQGSGSRVLFLSLKSSRSQDAAPWRPRLLALVLSFPTVYNSSNKKGDKWSRWVFQVLKVV